MATRDIEGWVGEFRRWAEAHFEQDSAHDTGHLARVWANARAIAVEEQEGDLLVLAAAAWLHDFVNLPKNHPRRAFASRDSATKAVAFLINLDFPHDKLMPVALAIQAHSYSAGVPATTPEGRILQDADRLDALGAVGVARCFAVGGQLGRALADNQDPLARHRPLDDQRYTLDHFAVKLERLPGLMHTAAGRRRAEARRDRLVAFKNELAEELTGGL